MLFLVKLGDWSDGIEAAKMAGMMGDIEAETGKDVQRTLSEMA